MLYIFTQIRAIDEAKRAAVLETSLKELDRLENDARPDLCLSTQAVEFEPVGYLDSQSVSITLENKRHVPCKFRLLPKPDTDSTSKPCFWVRPTSGVVLPGQKEKLNVTVNVDSDTVRKLNMGQEDLNDVVILSLVNSRDCFISISAKGYLPTSFANDLRRLVALPGPIRGQPPSQPQSAFEGTTTTEGRRASTTKPKVPKEITRMLEFLEEHGMGCVRRFLRSIDLVVVVRLTNQPPLT
jgi:hypothetical protein